MQPACPAEEAPRASQRFGHDEVAAGRGRALPAEGGVQDADLVGQGAEQGVDLVVEDGQVFGAVRVLDPHAVAERHRDAAGEAAALVDRGQRRRIGDGHPVHGAEEVGHRHADRRMVTPAVVDLEQLAAEELLAGLGHRPAHRHPDVRDRAGALEVGEDDALARLQHAIGVLLAAQAPTRPGRGGVLEGGGPTVVPGPEIGGVVDHELYVPGQFTLSPSGYGGTDDLGVVLGDMEFKGPLSRRSFLSTTARLAAVGSVAGVAPGLLRAKASGAPLASLPDPKGNPIEHVVVLMMENRSFDHYFGSLALTECRPDVRGLSADMANVGADGRSVKVFKMTDYCQELDPPHGFTDSKIQYADGKNYLPDDEQIRKIRPPD